MKRFWEIKARGDAPGMGVMTLYGEISDETWYGDEVTPAQFARELRALGNLKQLDVYINSPGGDVFAGLAIYNILKRRPAEHVSAHIDGLAASAASVIAMGADEIIMPKGAMLMIHNAWAYTAGNAEELRKMAGTLERIDGQLAQIYADRSDLSLEKAAQLMAEETWLDGRAALELGLCDRTEETEAAACGLTPELAARYRNAPEALKNTLNGDDSQPAKDKAAMEPATPATDLTEQRRRFAATRKKILDAMGGKNG